MLVSGSNSKGTPLSILVVSIEQPATSAHSSGNNDVFDQHNKPRLRRELILSALQKEYPELVCVKSLSPRKDVDLIDLYRRVHDVNMIEFILNAWTKWAAMGRDGGWYEECCHPEWLKNKEDCKDEAEVPPMVPCHVSFRRDGIERPSDNVMGALGYYCTDLMTPIVGTLVGELMGDAQVIEAAVNFAFQKMKPGDAKESPVESGAFPVVYAVTTHPGHHANKDNFGGYCYLNNAALSAKLMQERLESLTDISTESEPPNKKRKCRVAILDIDYHCGNGTASIFYRDSGIFFSSIHCDPEVEYPFNAGYVDQIGAEDGKGATYHIPLAPGATWEGTYKIAIEKAMNAILAYDVCGLVVSLGLDTYEGDSVAVNRGGFKLRGLDYLEIGKCMGEFMKGKNIPIVFVQEGGYKMDVVGEAAAHVVGGYAVGAGGD